MPQKGEVVNVTNGGDKGFRTQDEFASCSRHYHFNCHIHDQREIPVISAFVRGARGRKTSLRWRGTLSRSGKSIQSDCRMVQQFMLKHPSTPVYIVFQLDTSLMHGDTTTRALRINVDAKLVTRTPTLLEERRLFMNLGEVPNRFDEFQRRTGYWSFIGTRYWPITECGYGWAYVKYKAYPFSTNEPRSVDRDRKETEGEDPNDEREIFRAMPRSGYPTVKVRASESIVAFSSDGDQFETVMLRQRVEQVTYDHTELREIVVEDAFGLRPMPRVHTIIREMIEKEGRCIYPRELARIIAEYVGGADGIQGVRCIAKCMQELARRDAWIREQESSNISRCKIL